MLAWLAGLVNGIRPGRELRAMMQVPAIDVVIAWTTLPPDVDAAAFARTLVEEQLAACVTGCGPVRSVYRWQGAVEQADEQLVMIKTTTPCVDALRARVIDLHPYDTPEFIVAPVIDGAPDYLRWVSESTRSG